MLTRRKPSSTMAREKCSLRVQPCGRGDMLRLRLPRAGEQQVHIERDAQGKGKSARSTFISSGVHWRRTGRGDQNWAAVFHHKAGAFRLPLAHPHFETLEQNILLFSRQRLPSGFDFGERAHVYILRPCRRSLPAGWFWYSRSRAVGPNTVSDRFRPLPGDCSCACVLISAPGMASESRKK